MDENNNTAGADQTGEVQGIFTPQEELIEVDETTPTVEPPEAIQPVPVQEASVVRSNTTTASGSGDIKLNSGEKKSHKKFFVIFIIILLVAAIIGGVVFVLTQGVGVGNSNSTTQNAKTKFDQYATFILQGEAKNELAGEYDQTEYYKLSEEFNSTTFNAAFWDEARTLLAAAIDTYSGVKQPTNVVLGDLLLEYQKNFLLLETYKKIGSPLLSAAGVTMPGSSSQSNATLNSFLTNMGYSAPKSNTNTGKCATYTYKSSDPNVFSDQTIKICVPKVEGDKIIGLNGFSEVSQTTLPDGNKLVPIEVSGSSIRICSVSTIFCTQEYIYIGGGPGDGYTSWTEFTQAITAQLQSVKGTTTYRDNAGNTVQFTLQEGDVNREDYNTGAYELGDKQAAAMEAAKYLSKNGSLLGYGSFNCSDLDCDQFKLTNDEEIYLMQWYLNNTYDMDTYGCSLNGDQKAVAENNGYQAATIYKDSQWQECYVKAGSSPNKQVVSYGSEGHITGNSTLDFDGVLAKLGEHKGQVVENPGGVDGSNNDDSLTPGSGVDGLTACYGSAGPLGWITCPVLKVVGAMTTELYKYIEDNFLQIGTNISDAQGVRNGWGIFRDITNIIFVIAFLVVIVSQITGIGVSNYGIKKILPRLIVVIVLVNLSFILCQVAVDIV